MGGVKECCGNCSAWLPEPQNAAQGVCRAQPPSVLLVGEQVRGYFPPMLETGWCRQWAQKEKSATTTEVGDG